MIRLIDFLQCVIIVPSLFCNQLLIWQEETGI